MVKFILLPLLLSINYSLGIEFPDNDNKKRNYVESSISELSKKQKVESNITTAKVCHESDTSPEVVLSPDDLSSPTSSDHNSPPFNEISITTTKASTYCGTLNKYGKLTPNIIEFLDPYGILFYNEDGFIEEINFVTAISKVKEYIKKNNSYEQLSNISKNFDQLKSNYVEEDLNKLRQELRSTNEDHQDYNYLKWSTLAEWNFEKWPHQSTTDALLGYLFYPREADYLIISSLSLRVNVQLSLAFSAKYGKPLALYHLYVALNPGERYQYEHYDTAKKMLEEYEILLKTSEKFHQTALAYLYMPYKSVEEFSFEYLLLKHKITREWDHNLLTKLAKTDPRAMTEYGYEKKDKEYVTPYFRKAYDLGYKKAALGICRLIKDKNFKEGFEQYLYYAKKDSLGIIYSEMAHIMSASRDFDIQNYPELEQCDEAITSIVGSRMSIIIRTFELAGDKGEESGYYSAIADLRSYNPIYPLPDEYTRKTIVNKIVDIYKKYGESGKTSAYFDLGVVLSTIRNTYEENQEAIKYFIKSQMESGYYRAIALENDDQKRAELIKQSEKLKKFHKELSKTLLLDIAFGNKNDNI